MRDEEIRVGRQLLWDPPLGGGLRAVTVTDRPSPIDGLTEVDVPGYGTAYAFPAELAPITGD